MAAQQRRWAWHRLDPAWAERVVAESGVSRGDLVVDVGAGLGAITAPLLDAGARVIAIEAHPGRADDLRRRFGTRVVVVQADARALRLPRRPYHVVANPPFDATSALFKRILQPGTRLVSARLVLQDRAARHWAGADAPGRRRWEAAFDVWHDGQLPRAAFRPRPHVDVGVLAVRRRQGAS